jgi:hypothetical protein
MSDKNTGGPAFPRAPFTYIDGSNGLDWAVREQSGMTLRDYFAAKAMQGMYTSETFPTGLIADTATEAYQMADAMLKARNQ